jgi:hypothetical protein
MSDTKIIYRMSSVGHCQKALGLQRLGVIGKAKPESLSSTAEEGNLHELAIKSRLRSEGYDVYGEQNEYKVSTPLFDLIGHIDGIAKEANGDISLLECKSMSEFEFARWRKGQFSEFPYYAAQLSCYFHVTQLSSALYIVKNRNNGLTLRHFFTTENVPLFQSILDKLTHIETLALQNKCAEAEYNPDAVECRRCDYINNCAPTFKPTIQQTIILDAAVAEWRRGKALEAQAKEIIESSRVLFEEHAAALPQRKFFLSGLNVQLITTKRETYEKKELLKLFSEEALKPALKVSTSTSLRILDFQAKEEEKES